MKYSRSGFEYDRDGMTWRAPIVRDTTGSRAGVAESVDATDLRRFECSSGNRGCRTAQIRGNHASGNPEPSPETGRCRD